MFSVSREGRQLWLKGIHTNFDMLQTYTICCIVSYNYESRQIWLHNIII